MNNSDNFLTDKQYRKYSTVNTDKSFIEAEERRLRKIANCDHPCTITIKRYDKYSCRCDDCGCVIDSDAISKPEIKTPEQII